MRKEGFSYSEAGSVVEDSKKPKVDSRGEYVDPAGVKWVSATYIRDVTGKSHGKSFSDRLKDVPAIEGVRTSGEGSPFPLYRKKEALEAFSSEESISTDPRTNIYTDGNNKRWVPRGYIEDKFIFDGPSHYNRLMSSIEHINGRNRSGTRGFLYDLDAVEGLDLPKRPVEFLDEEVPEVDPVTGVYTSPSGKQYISTLALRRQTGCGESQIKVILKKCPVITGRGKQGQIAKLYDLSAAMTFIEEAGVSKAETEVGNFFTDEDGKEWGSYSYFQYLFNTSEGRIRPFLRQGDFPKISRGKKGGHEVAYYGVQEVVAAFAHKKDNRSKPRTADDLENNRSLEVLKSKVLDLISEIADQNSGSAKTFYALINLFGASRYLDILFKFNPDFKRLPVAHVKGIVADYLGDFLVTKGNFRPADIKIATEHLSDLSFQEGLYETIKADCLRHYFLHRQSGESNSQMIIDGYLGQTTEALQHLHNRTVDDIILRVVEYYDSLFRDFKKPSAFVDGLAIGRDFPDVNQRINMKELAEKKRLLIADGMGLGKSASVIMAKEQFKKDKQDRLKEKFKGHCALVIAPSNVLSTWERYLSEEKRGNAKEGGYFKQAEAPRVLTVVNLDDLSGVSESGYDYILLSQERLGNNGYANKLLDIDYDMLIVDEVHKLKRVEGARAPELLRLAEKIKGPDMHLALLSGTPIPNKIEDMALLLKLLYPERFAESDNKELVRQIIHGDIIDLRSLLVPRMQMKDLHEGVEMPPLTEKVTRIELNQQEKNIYEVLLDDDELSASTKIGTLRQFLLNPEFVQVTPALESSKITRLSVDLQAAFREHDKVVVFVNDYIEGIIRGENSMLKKLNLPPEVTVHAVHGNIDYMERARIQRELHASTGKILLVVSGQTADVGVDYSGAERVFFYNEPWTEYQRRQELARVYRPGLRGPLVSDALVTKGTIEEGIHEYIQRKYMAVEKLLRGVPITELEQQLLENDEKSKEPDLSVNPELAEYYFSSWDKMMKMFGYVKNIGEADFLKFLRKQGVEYADGYADLGARSFQSNANRVTGTLIAVMARAEGSDRSKLNIIDLASGPEMLRSHIAEEFRQRVFSVDINREHFLRQTSQIGDKRLVASVLNLPFADNSFHFANFSLAFQYLNFAPSKGQYERLQALAEINRVLTPGGRVIINIMYSLEPKDFNQFKALAGELGFRVIEEYTGEVNAGNSYRSRVITLEKNRALSPELSIKDLSKLVGSDKHDGLKMKPTKEKIKDSRRIITAFELKGKRFNLDLNDQDSEIYQEEQSLLAQGEGLKAKFGSIKNIPAPTIIENGFVRIRIGEKYVLFKKLIKGPGVVVIK